MPDRYVAYLKQCIRTLRHGDHMSDEEEKPPEANETKEFWTALGIGVWAAGGAHVLGTAAVLSSGPVVIPLAAGAIFYHLWAGNAFKAAFKK